MWTDSDMENQIRSCTSACATAAVAATHTQNEEHVYEKVKSHKQSRADESVMGVRNQVLKVTMAEKGNRPMMPVLYRSGMWRSAMITLYLTSTVILSRSRNGGVHSYIGATGSVCMR